MKSMLEHKTAINFQSIYPKSILFNLNVDPSKKIPHKAEVSMLIGYERRFEDDDRKLIACVTVEIPNEDKKLPLSISVSYEGIFTIPGDSPVKDLADFSEYTAAGIILPYVRSEISRITALTGLTPINIPPINVQKLITSQESAAETVNEEEKK